MKDQDERSWHPDGANVPWWVVPAAIAVLSGLLALVYVAVASM